MRALRYKCTLLSDIVLNPRSATAGLKQTLDYIPGNNFLGIVASKLYPDETLLSATEKLRLFHTDAVRFGDAHPGTNNNRTIRIPASMYYPKTKSLSEAIYIHHLIEDFESLKSMQLKQAREGFYTFGKDAINAISINKSFAIKSGYDRDYRRSKDEAMYGYESLNKGLELFFEISLSDRISKELEALIDNAISGTQRVGRSRSAQYGLVSIERCEYNMPSSTNTSFEIVTEAGLKMFMTVYADSRLIFLDENSYATFQPDAKSLGFSEGEIRWDLSQIRTFQYAPWNFKRQAYDTDRCGIEKGSVFVVMVEKDQIPATEFVGSYLNEGFGHVIFNPVFLNAQHVRENGLSIYRETKVEKCAEEEHEEQIPENDQLLKYLNEQKKEEARLAEIYKIVNDLVREHKGDFKEDAFASQWGAIRSIAMKNGEKDKMFGEIEKYLTHGIALEKWEKKGRLDFINTLKSTFEGTNAQLAMINLAAQMAKECKRK